MWEHWWGSLSKGDGGPDSQRIPVYSHRCLQVSLDMNSLFHTCTSTTKFLLSGNQEIWIPTNCYHPLSSSSPDYYVSTTSVVGMEDVLVVTLPQRIYTTGSSVNETVSCTSSSRTRPHEITAHLQSFIFHSFWQINDYVAGYHDGTLLFGKVLRERMLSNQKNNGTYNGSNDNPFGDISFYGAYYQR